MVDIKQLPRVPLFEHISPHRLEHMLSAAEMVRYEKSETLFHQGERAKAIWLILEGWVHLVRSTPGDGSHAVLIFTITPREVLCGISALESSVYHVSAVAGTECLTVRIPSEAFNEALTREPALAHDVLRLCIRRIQHIAQQYGSMAEPVSNRVIRAILRLQQQFGSTIPVTHRELAQMSWTTTESAIRMVRRLKQRGYVTGSRGQLTVSNAKALERVLKEVNGRHPPMTTGRLSRAIEHGEWRTARRDGIGRRNR